MLAFFVVSFSFSHIFIHRQFNTLGCVFNDDTNKMTCSSLLSKSIASAVLNFFAMPSEDECKSEDGLRSGVCMNVYECHQKGGTAKGQCALGFGSCCVCKWFLV